MHVSLGEIDVDVDWGYLDPAGKGAERKEEKRDIIRLQKRREMAERCRVSSR